MQIRAVMVWGENAVSASRGCFEVSATDTDDTVNSYTADTFMDHACMLSVSHRQQVGQFILRTFFLFPQETLGLISELSSRTSFPADSEEWPNLMVWTRNTTPIKGFLGFSP